MLILSQESYVRNIMKLSLSLPRIMPPVMAVTMEKMVQIDADIEEGDPPTDDDASSTTSETEDDESDADTTGNTSDGPIFALEEYKGSDSFRSPRQKMDDSDDESSSASNESEDTTEDEQSAEDAADENITPQGKLDALMFLSLDFVKMHMLTGEESARTMFEVLWKEFVRVVLPTYHSKHVQYLLFYACRCVCVAVRDCLLKDSSLFLHHEFLLTCVLIVWHRTKVPFLFSVSWTKFAAIISF